MTSSMSSIVTELGMPIQLGSGNWELIRIENENGVRTAACIKPPVMGVVHSLW